MYNGVLEYAADVASYYEIEASDVTVPHPSIDRATISCTSREGLSVKFHMKQVPSEKEAKQVFDVFIAACNDLAERVINRLAFNLGTYVGEPRLKSSTLVQEKVRPDGSIDREIHAKEHVQFTEESTVITTNPGIVIALQDSLQAPAKQSGEDYFTLFRSALGCQDVVARFMFLYAILLQILGDRQTAVDQFISQVEPGVAQSPSPLPRRGMETVYTRLRNEVGHVRASPNINRTRNEMQQHIHGLIEIVKTLINQQP